MCRSSNPNNNYLFKNSTYYSLVDISRSINTNTNTNTTKNNKNNNNNNNNNNDNNQCFSNGGPRTPSGPL